jgi:hypothetical protein
VEVIKEILALGRLLPACKFAHVQREANQVAHELAQRALGKQQGVVRCLQKFKL